MAHQIESPLVLRIPRRGEWPVRSYEEASAIYCAERDRSGLGCSDFADGEILGAGEPFARVSYNGRVWPPVEWEPGIEPIIEAQRYVEGMAA